MVVGVRLRCSPPSRRRGGVATRGVSLRRDACYDIRELTRSLDMRGDLVSLFQAELCDKGYLEDESRRGRDRRCHGKKYPSLVKKGLMTT